MRRLSRSISLILASLTVSCAAVPQLGSMPTVRAPGALVSARSLAGTSVAWPGDGWWSDFGDTQLTMLIETGLQGSPDVAAADARIRSADALSQQAGAVLQPSLSVDASAGGTQQSKNMGFPRQFVPDGVQDTGRVTASLSFNLDLWGKNRAALRAAKGEAEAARVDAAQARLMISSAIAAAYADLQQLYDQRDVAAQALDVRAATAKLTAQRVQVGVDTRGSLRQAEARVPAARADLKGIDEAIALTQHRIAALMGAGPDRGLSITRPQLAATPVGLPADAAIDLIGRRPDLVAAKLRAEAAADRIKVARRDFYPNLNLSVLAGLQSLGLGNLFVGGSQYGNGGVAISLPVFDGGRIAGRYRQARAEYDGAVARYDASLVQALREVADAVTSRTAADARLADQRAALSAAAEAAQIARIRYRGGLSNQLPVLIAEDTELSARRAVADLQARRIALDIQLIRALGGGYRTDTQIAGTR
jgi:NodT family efflux transporter outer membrane factor (OMF) lipoprotein